MMERSMRTFAVANEVDRGGVPVVVAHPEKGGGASLAFLSLANTLSVWLATPNGR